MALLTVGSGGIPVGSYSATFAGVESQPANTEKGYAAGLKWRWTVESGPCAGQVATRITSAAPSPRNACGKILSGLLGRALIEGESIDPATCMGKKYMLMVAAGQTGGTRVEAVIAVN